MCAGTLQDPFRSIILNIGGRLYTVWTVAIILREAAPCALSAMTSSRYVSQVLPVQPGLNVFERDNRYHGVNVFR